MSEEKKDSNKVARNLVYLMEHHGLSTAEAGRRMPPSWCADAVKRLRKFRRIAIGMQEPKLTDIQALASVFGVHPGDLAFEELADLEEYLSPLTPLGSSRGCGAPVGWGARGGTPRGIGDDD